MSAYLLISNVCSFVAGMVFTVALALALRGNDPYNW